MRLTQNIYDISKQKYSFVLSVIFFIALYTLFVYIFFPDPLIRVDNLDPINFGLVFIPLPLAIFVGFAYSDKNSTNPYTVEETGPWSLYTLISGFILYFISTGLMYFEYISIGYIDPVSLLLLYIGGILFGSRMYKKTWVGEIEDEEEN